MQDGEIVEGQVTGEEQKDGGGSPLGQMEFYKIDFTKKVPK